MLKLYNYEGKNLEEVKEKAFKELKVEETDALIKETEQEGSIFKSKKVLITVLLKKDIKEYIKEYLKQIEESIGIEIQYEIREQDDTYIVQLISNNNSILIGRDGKTMTAIQFLIKQSIFNQSGFSIRLNVDVSNYKAKKIDNLEYQVKKIIREVQKTKVDVELDHMNSYERRCIHTLVSNYPELSSESIGEGEERHIVIRYNK